MYFAQRDQQSGLSIQLIKRSYAEAVYAPFANKDDRNTPTAEAVISMSRLFAFINVVLDKRNALFAKIRSCLLAVTASLGGIHDDLSRRCVFGSRWTLIFDMFVGVNLSNYFFGAMRLIRLITKMHFSARVDPLIDFGRYEIRKK